MQLELDRGQPLKDMVIKVPGANDGAFVSFCANSFVTETNILYYSASVNDGLATIATQYRVLVF